MILQIEIPEEFEDDFKKDCFNECFERIDADIDFKGLAGLYEVETLKMLKIAFMNAKIIKRND